jgi:hypothetical protein
MQVIFLLMPALLLAGTAVAESGSRPNPLDPQAKVPPVEFRSTLNGYRPFADQEMRDWRKANEEVDAAGGDAGQRAGQAASQQTFKPQPWKSAPAHQGHEGHK